MTSYIYHSISHSENPEIVFSADGKHEKIIPEPTLLSEHFEKQIFNFQQETQLETYEDKQDEMWDGRTFVISAPETMRLTVNSDGLVQKHSKYSPKAGYGVRMEPPQSIFLLNSLWSIRDESDTEHIAYIHSTPFDRHNCEVIPQTVDLSVGNMSLSAHIHLNSPEVRFLYGDPIFCVTLLSP